LQKHNNDIRKGGLITEERLTRLQAKLEADQSWAEKLFSLETPEEVQSFLKTQGLEFSLEEIDTLKNALVKAVTKSAGSELTDDDLEDVAGGGSFWDDFIDALADLITFDGHRW
jgi:predicted ribosomally synthesized peptide with nif11-like leader